MLDPKNLVNLTCGIVADPERVPGNEDILKLRVAIDYAGQEKDSDNKSGYFDVVYYLDNGSTNASFVKSQVENNNLSKGSQIQLLGTLKQRRWKAEDGSGRSAVQIQAESITYAGGGKRTDSDNSETSQQKEAQVAEVPDTF